MSTDDNDEAPRISTRTRLREVLGDILLKINDDDAPSVGGDDTVIDLETDAELILLAIKQLHNKYGHKHAKNNNCKYGEPNIELINEDKLSKLNRGGYGSDEWDKIYFTLTGKFPKIDLCDENDKQEECIQ